MNNLQRTLEYSRRYWKPLTFSIICASLFGLVSAMPTYLIKQTVDDIFVKKYQHLIIPFILAFLVFFILKGLFMYLSSYYMNWVGNRVINDIRNDLFSKIIYFPMSFFQKTTTGQLMSHFLNDIQMIQGVAAMVVKDGVRSFFESLFLLSFAFYQSWQLTTLMLIVGPLIGITISKMGKARKIAAHAIQIEIGKTSNMLQETFVGIREIKAFNAEKIECKQFNTLLDRCFSSIMRNVHIESLAPAAIEIIAMLGCCIVFYVAAQQVLSNQMTAGQLTSFVAATLLAYQPLKKLINLFADIQYGLSAADRIFDLMDKIYPATQNRNIILNKFDAVIRWENVSFQYSNNVHVIKDINLSINKGDCVGIIGPSGAGKSTFCDLLLGFISPTTGIILVDNIDLASVSLVSLRNHIGYVGQRTFLFNDTIYNNILYARPNATEQEIIAASKAAYAHEFIQTLPDGYQTMVGENGTLLSGGQKQRITIARALLKDPEILIFDEATSALDHESEHNIQRAITGLKKKKTLIIVSHRQSMLNQTDRILTIQNKAIFEKIKELKDKSLPF